MSKIKIELNDQPDGTVKVVCTPNGAELLGRFKDGHDMSKAESMTVMFLLKLLSDSTKSNYDDRKIIVPPSLQT